MKCTNPDCTSPYGPFEIECKTTVTVHDDGTDNDLHDTEWDDKSFAQCCACGYMTTVGALRGVTLEAQVAKALELIEKYGGIDGGHHKQWVLDQVVRALTGGKYADWVSAQCSGENSPCTYNWDVGIAP